MSDPVGGAPPVDGRPAGPPDEAGRRGRSREDALDLVREADTRLDALFEGWRRTHEGSGGTADPATRARNRGTISKMILEEVAARVAAVDDVERVLRSSGHDDRAEVLRASQEHVTSLLRRLDAGSRGVVAESLRYSDEFHSTMERLMAFWADGIRPARGDLDRLAADLGPAREKLHTLRHLRKRAPLHPARHGHWYQGLPLVARVHALYDRIRSLPDAASRPSSRVSLTRRYRRDGR